MSSSESALINARIEYLESLADLMAPHILEVIAGMWVESKRRVRAFQLALQTIPRWNSEQFDEHTRAIESRARYLDKLIAAVLIATVKLLASIKVHDGEEQVRLKLPTNEAFVAKVFVKTAKIFYESPDLVRDSPSQKVQAVQIAVEKAVRDMLPLADLLTSYTAGGGNSTSAEADATEEGETEPAAAEEEAEPPAEEPTVDDEDDAGMNHEDDGATGGVVEDEGEGATKHISFENQAFHQGAPQAPQSFGAAPQMPAPSPYYAQQAPPPPPPQPQFGSIPPAPPAPTAAFGGAQQSLRPDAQEKIDW